MAIRAQALAAGLLPVVRQVLLGQPPLEKRPRIDSRRRVRLEVHQVSQKRGGGPLFFPRGAAAEEVIEAHLEQIRRGGVARDMSAELRMRSVRAHYHGERVPAHDGRDAAFELEVA